ncbi:uncharacterized protein LOC103788956 [Callithrix jacchus]
MGGKSPASAIAQLGLHSTARPAQSRDAGLGPAEARPGCKAERARETRPAGLAGSRHPGAGVAPRALLPLAARRLDVGFGCLPEAAAKATREEELASREVSSAPNFSSSLRGAGGGRKRGRGRWGQRSTARGAARVSVSLNPSPPAPRGGAGTRGRGGVGRGDWRPGRVQPSAVRGTRDAGRGGAARRALAGVRSSHRGLARAPSRMASPGPPGLPIFEAASAPAWAGEVGRSEPEPARGAPHSCLTRRPQSRRSLPASGARMPRGAAGWQAVAVYACFLLSTSFWGKMAEAIFRQRQSDLESHLAPEE